MKRVGNFRGFAVAFMMLLFTVSTSEAQQSDCRLWGRDLYKEGNYKQAIEVLLSCELTEEDSIATEWLLASWFHSGDIIAAGNYFKAIPDSLLPSNLWSWKARTSFSAGAYDDAVMGYSKLVETDSLNVNYIRQLALSAEKNEQPDLAILNFEKALTLNPKDIISGTKLIDWYLRKDELLKADSLSTSLMTADSLPELCRLRGDVLYRLKEYEQAFIAYRPLLQKGTSNPELLRKAGICQFMSGETEQSITMLSTALMIQPDDDITCYYLGMAYQATGDFKKAELYIRGAIEKSISQNISVYYHRMAKIYESAGEYKNALDAYKNAYRYSGDDLATKAGYQYEIGRVYEVYMQDTLKALEHYAYFLNAQEDTSDWQYKMVKSRTESMKLKVSPTESR
ncbi:MAG: tetratricopeptide repeat protein [Bacteroidia bacterium]|nr:tetratricopeptide repeat protein [Bacteroidia bacterium]